MTDTLPEIAEIVRKRMMSLTGEDRFLMGIRMFDAAREMILASLPANLSREELRRQLFERLYGQRMPS